MATEDPLDFAHTAISRVAKIAHLRGVESKQPVCGRLGAELFIIADYLDTAGLDQEKQLRLRESKLLRGVEAICNVKTSEYLSCACIKTDKYNLVAAPSTKAWLSPP